MQSTHTTPPTPQVSAVVPLLQFPPLSQHPVHCGQGTLAPDPDDDVAVDVELVAEELVVLSEDEDDEVRELALLLVRVAVVLDPPGPTEVDVAPVVPVATVPRAVDVACVPLLP